MVEGIGEYIALRPYGGRLAPRNSALRLTAIYDELDGDRCDLDRYEVIVDELGARSVLDIGCGTGTLACRLVARGVTVVGVDPAPAPLERSQEPSSARRSERDRQVHDRSGIFPRSGMLLRSWPV